MSSTLTRPAILDLLSTRTLLILAGALLALSPVCVTATTVAGRTAGSFAVSSTGAATYAIPIWAPPGPHGLQPSIALTYNSRSGNGIVGVGWSISGLSSISRCNLTYAQDAAAAPVSLATSDGYCMDGQRLRLTSGTYGLAGSTYQTEIANFINVTAVGAAGNGPSYFTAQDRGGRTYTYGNGGNSQILLNGTAASWQLNEVSDPAGNTMTVAYAAANGTTVPSSISWTPTSHGAPTYNNFIQFAYQTLPVPESAGYLAGQPTKNLNLLTTIGIGTEAGGTLNTIKVYFLSYSPSPTTGQERLTTVTECADSGEQNCLLPTNITYQTGQAGVTSIAATAPGVTPVLQYDFNGDGHPDAAYFSGGVLYVALNTGSGFGTPINTGITDTTAMYGDVLGTGTDGILAKNGGTYYYYTYNSSSNSFSGVTTGIAVQSGYKYALTDITGDGLPDLVGLFGLTDQMVTIQNTSSGGAVLFGTPYYFTSTFTTGNKFQFLSATSGHPNPNRYLDFNGDGRNDVFVETITWTQIGQGEYDFRSNYYQLISQGANAPLQVVQVTFDNTSGQNVVFGNFNDDNCTDIAVGNEAYFSGCNGTIGQVVSLSGSDSVIAAIDWDGDGLTDLLAGSPGSSLNWYHSTRSGFASEVSTGYTLASSCPEYPSVIDVDGDGLEDLQCASSYYVHNGAAQPPDLLHTISDGYGNSASPSYVSIVQSNYAEHNGGDAAYPYQDYVGPMYVVSQVTISDPSTTNGTYSQSFMYYGAWTNLQGRGWQSFYAMRTTDSRYNPALYHYEYYGRSFPSAGMKVEDIVSNGTFYPSQWVGTSATTTLSSTPYEQRYFPYLASATASIRELAGPENGVLVTTANSTYAYDNFGNQTSVSTTVTDNDPGSPNPNPYSGQTWTTVITNTPVTTGSTWPSSGCVSLFSGTVTAYTASPDFGKNAVTPVTITRALTPDTTHCDYTQVVTQPGSSFAVTEALAYDGFGNLNSDTVTGANMTGRLTTANWGSTGQFLLILTDASGATTTSTYTSVQSLGFGVPDSVEDANNLTTSWLYDGFGRQTKETRPDGTYTSYSYTNCAGTTGCLVGTNGLNVAYSVYGTNASQITYGGQYYDSAIRLVMADQEMLSGSLSRRDVQYDSFGRVHMASFPCVYSSFTATCTNWTTNSYDELNRLTQSQRPISSTNSTPQTTSYVYAGRETTVTDPTPNTTTTLRDVNGWLRQSTDAFGVTNGYTVTLAYDAAGDKTLVTDSGNNTLWSGTYNYGIGAFPATATDTDLGAWTFGYDALGERTSWKDAKGNSFSETYDALSRPRSRTEPDLFSQWTWGSSVTNHNVGKLQSECTGTGTACTSAGYSESETYDSVGRLFQRAITISGYSPFNYTWTYDAATGLLSSLTYPTSTSGYALELQYGYTNGFLATVKDISDTPNVTVWAANTMDPAGHVTQETLGNGLVTRRSYDAVTQWLGTAQSGVGGGAGVKNLAFLHDYVGNLEQRQDVNLGLTENIYYDSDYRFSYSTLNGSQQNLSLTYYPNGNIKSRSDVAGGTQWNYGVTSQLHAVTQAGTGTGAYQYSYDANGNMTAREGTTTNVTWMDSNYPSTVSSGSGSTAEVVSFAYGPDRQRWQQMYTGNGTQETTNYIGGLFEVAASGSATTYRHYITAGGAPVAVYLVTSSGKTLFYLLSDHQGSVASIANNSGVQTVGESFDAFGSRRNPTTWSGPDSNSDLTTIAGITRQGYTFQTALGLWMGMSHMNGRVQDPIIGRFLSPDPYVPDAANSQSYNAYSYVNNNPLSYVDPSGFAGCTYNTPEGSQPPGSNDNGQDNSSPMATQPSDPSQPQGANDCNQPPTPPPEIKVYGTPWSYWQVMSDVLKFALGGGPWSENPWSAGSSGANDALPTVTVTAKDPCNLLAKIAGSAHNFFADWFETLYLHPASVQYGVDIVGGAGRSIDHKILYFGMTASFNSLWQGSLSVSTSNRMQGFVYGGMLGAGRGVGLASGPVIKAQSNPYVTVAGYALPKGYLASISLDKGSVTLPGSLNQRGDVTGGVGFGFASGPVDQTTFTSPPLLPRLTPTVCHL